MTEIISKTCRICLKNSYNSYISDATPYIDFLTNILCIKIQQRSLWLCIWCRSTLKRTKVLLELAEESERVFAEDNLENFDTIHKTNRELYKLSINHNIHIDIPPIDNTELKANSGFIKCIINETEESCHAAEEYTKQELKIGLNRKKLIKTEMCKEMQFEVNFLSVAEQIKEIEDKQMREKYINMKFQCILCGIGFLTEDVFEEHNLRHSKTASAYECQICHLWFKSQDVLSQHSLAHKRRFTCLVCGAIFKRWSHCIAHRYKCGTVATLVTCNYCTKMFSNEHSLDIHTKGVHKKENKYMCVHCKKRFASKQRLTVHVRSHTGQKPFACERCSRTFATNSNLRAHSSVHADVKQHYCVECNTYYKTEKSLKRHFSESARHLNIKEMTYSCMDCSKHFSSEKILKSHINSRHLTTYTCEQCNKKFSNKTNLNKHVRCIHAPK